MKRIVVILVIVMAVVAAGLYGYMLYTQSKTPKVILTFEDCANAGNLVVDTNPRECHTKSGQFYVEEDNHVVLADYIQVTDPKPYSLIATPFKISGQAKGKWYGNNRLTIQLVDMNMRIFAEKSVFALSDTSKDEMVPFVARSKINYPKGGIKLFRITLFA